MAAMPTLSASSYCLLASRNSFNAWYTRNGAVSSKRGLLLRCLCAKTNSFKVGYSHRKRARYASIQTCTSWRFSSFHFRLASTKRNWREITCVRIAARIPKLKLKTARMVSFIIDSQTSRLQRRSKDAGNRGLFHATCVKQPA